MERDTNTPKFLHRIRASRVEKQPEPAPRDRRGTWALVLSVIATAVSVVAFASTYYETSLQRAVQATEAFNDVIAALGLNEAGTTTSFEPGVNIPLDDEKLRQAREAIDRFEILSGEEEAADVLHFLWLIAAGDFEAAQETRIADLMNASAEAMGYGRPGLFATDEQWEETMDSNLERAFAADPSNVVLATAYGVRLHFKNDNERAVVVLERAAIMEPTNTDTNLALGHVLMESNRTDEAERVLLTAVEGSFANAETFNTLGVLYAYLGRHDEAVRRYRQAISANARTGHFYVNLNRSLLALGKQAEAEVANQHALRLGGTSGGSHLETRITPSQL